MSIPIMVVADIRIEEVAYSLLGLSGDRHEHGGHDEQYRGASST